MIIKGNKIFGENGFYEGKIELKNGEIADTESTLKADVEGEYVLPGFIDIHTHGCAGHDTMDATIDGMKAMSEYMAKNGVTSFLPTTMTMSREQIMASILCAKEASQCDLGANIAGVYLEGPYFCEAKKGGQNGKYLRLPDISEAMEWIKAGEGMVKVISIAPELSGALDFAEKISQHICVSAGHTDASYEQAKEGMKHGICHITHLYNAMSPFTHRNPGMVCAALDSDVTAEIICDGIHVHSAAVCQAIKCKGADNMVVISDSMRAAGMPDGVYDLGGQEIIVKDKKALTHDGNLAGSTTNLLDEFKNLVSWGVDIESIIKMTSENPARVTGLNTKGKIKNGYDADITILDKNFNLVHTVVGGKIAY